jgi:hypothetical protein
MIEDKHLKRQFTVKDQVGSLEMGVENMTGRLDSNPHHSGDISRKTPLFYVLLTSERYSSCEPHSEGMWNLGSLL